MWNRKRCNTLLDPKRKRTSRTGWRTITRSPTPRVNSRSNNSWTKRRSSGPMTRK